MHRALLLDRDGVINIDRGYVSEPADFEFVPGVLELLWAAQTRGFLLIIVTNQSGIARGYFSYQRYAQLEDYMRNHLSAEGIDLAAVYVCPHHPDGSIPEFAINCDCRKPKPGLIRRAERDFNLDLQQSILVGDKESDIEAASLAGVGSAFLISTSILGQNACIFAEPIAAMLTE